MRWVKADCALIRKSNQFFFFKSLKETLLFCKRSRDRTRLSIDEKPKHNKGDDDDDNDDF